MPPDEDPPTSPQKPPELPSPAHINPQSLASPAHVSQQPSADASLPKQEIMAQPSLCSALQPQPPVTPAPSLQEIVPPAPPSNFPHLPPASSVVWAGPESSSSPLRSVPIPVRRGGFRRTHSIWKPRFNAAAPQGASSAYACSVQLAPPKLRLRRFHHPRRQAHRINLLRRTSTAGPGDYGSNDDMLHRG